MMSNPYISYINSLHNVSANGANALAESQALNAFFPDIYEPFPIVPHVSELLADNKERVVILTGHAGDGKSTVALDILKQLRGISAQEKLSKTLKEREIIDNVNISIVKDMSELSRTKRQEWLEEAFQFSGSWLIVSNTGPLLESLSDYVTNKNINIEIESKILQALNQSLESETTPEHHIDGLEKDLVIINLTRVDNVDLGSKLVTKLVQHPAWDTCQTCQYANFCAIKKNRDITQESIATVEERVRWIYSRLTAYEHRLTLRQILAHISFSLTGGKNCKSISSFHSEASSTDELQEILFSELFFGLSAGKHSYDAQSLHAIDILSRGNYGAPIGVEFEQQLYTLGKMDWAELPSNLSEIKQIWLNRAQEANGICWRFALRRMHFMFGQLVPSHEKKANEYLDAFLDSYGVRLFDQWKISGELNLSKVARKKLKELCLNVMLELFTGFSANQYSTSGQLYITLRRKDQNVVQSTLLVNHVLSFRDFDIGYDKIKQLPMLVFDKNTAEFPLSLPLFDYFQARNRGELGSSLSPIHQFQIDRFQSELLRVTEDDRDDDELCLLKAGINGRVSIHRFSLDQEQGSLEIES